MNTATEPLAAVRHLRIGYVPVDSTLQQPSDRTRFCHYARRRGLTFELADPARRYDVVVVGTGADISVWVRYPPGHAKMIYELLDSYLALPPFDLKMMLRGAAKFAVRQNRRLLLDYRAGIEEMARRADAVICTTAEQRQQLLQYCGNVHVVLDFHEREVRKIKRDYAAGEVFNFVWQGLPENLRYFSTVGDIITRVARKRRIALHAMTDLEYGQFLHGLIGKRYAFRLARAIPCDVYLYQWNQELFASVMTACDLALIPIDPNDPLGVGKPENKLVLFWRLGIPALVSATPAYARVMRESGLAMACATNADWEAGLQLYIEDEGARRSAGERGRAFAEEHYGEAEMMARWDAVLASVL
jgi:glycosyltransferase involved in cell wall biosynthesis